MAPSDVRALCEALIEGRITAEERTRLQALVLGSADARRCYLDYLHQHATLAWAGGAPEANSAREADAA